ncbi:uncharacterized protein MONOS_2646 [Monocercomonoides exilis]|uniref:uncharacterized protein n=1 Tax=Monocercomonoides exilis TaxID=2049356 RepID=UPI00355AC5AA|nr:hypothetical protein MONOS_2646 [Monocercomonoides exilis]|eukprot:MONOS_2646.1-p1 / transcript=MONOS_2646.1 / gene=MONOS_2646 / organism=Monocercomonoides_exilis_PA203 / gene_product=unspecified product / transcript_product=unspecified product / location=Mono_scaffold00056:751-1559(-) / protein_length=165 / sequence_SO=supercontig / SO=protein_coding / is_pseudo=false
MEKCYFSSEPKGEQKRIRTRMNEESRVCQDDIDEARAEAKRRKLQKLDEERAQLYLGSPHERRAAQQKQLDALKEQMKEKEYIKHSGSSSARVLGSETTDLSDKIRQTDEIRAQERRAQEIALREQNKKIAEERRVAKEREKVSDARYVESTEAFIGSFGKSLR